MKPRTIYFCGDQSPYGRAHLRPVLDAFDVVGVVTATPARWATFREALSGPPHPPPRALVRASPGRSPAPSAGAAPATSTCRAILKRRACPGTRRPT